MSRFSDATLEQVRGRLDIVELVREYVPSLKRAGRHFKACCPFHSEKTPSFMVNPDKQIFHCFGCQEGGDIFKFVMKMENLSFPQAVQDLAGRAGVTLDSDAGGALSGRDKDKLDLRRALEFAVQFYQETLKGPKGAQASAYLDRRRIAAESRAAFQLGWAPGDGTSFLEAALKKGFAPQILEKAGLAGFQEQRGRYYDYFRDRLLFPIFSAKGEILGFGGRVLDDREPKYLNSPDTLLFSKGRVLYGLWQAAAQARQSRRVIVLEGYTDVIACHRFGFSNAVAPLGTALTPDHAMALKRLCEETILLFDPDAAGVAASLRGAELLMEAEMGVRIASLPDGVDADEFLESEGAEAFAARIEAAVDLAEFKTGVVLLGLPKQPSLAQKVKAAASVLETIAKQPNLVLRKEWVKRLAERMDLDPESLTQEMSRKTPKVSARARAAAAPQGAKPALAAHPAAGIEVELLRFFLKHPERLSIEPRLEASRLLDPFVRRAYEALSELAAQGAANAAAALLEKLPEDSAWLTALVVEDKASSSPETMHEKLVRDLERHRNQDRLKELKARAESLSSEELREFAELSARHKGSPAAKA